MAGRTCLVTGGTSGVGRALARGLSGLGAHVVILARDAARGRDEAAKIARRSGHAVDVLPCDLADMRSVARAAGAFKSRWARLDVLAHAAGLISWKRRLSVDGYELTFAVNLLGPALLTRGLLSLLERSAPARIISVSGGLSTVAHARLDLEELERRDGRFAPLAAPLEVMLAKIVYFMELGRRLEAVGVTVNSFFPGLVRSRLDRGLPLPLRLAARVGQPFLKAGSAAAVRAAADPGLKGVSGAFLSGKRVLRFQSRHVTPEVSQRLWSLVEAALDRASVGG
jgi:NAD(P)-dependent dehydrogenase (short-subunit alcohol dehydrogenase family)